MVLHHIVETMASPPSVLGDGGSNHSERSRIPVIRDVGLSGLVSQGGTWHSRRAAVALLPGPVRPCPARKARRGVVVGVDAFP